MQTNENIIAASKEINSARPMRCYIDTIIKQAVDDLNHQKDATDDAFRRRIEEIKQTKMKLELQHSEVQSYILHSYWKYDMIGFVLFHV